MTNRFGKLGLAVLVIVFFLLSGCAKKQEPIMYDDEFQGCLSILSIQCSYADMFQIYESIEEAPDRSQLACIPCILEFGDLIPYETVLASSAGDLADFVMVYHAKIVFDFALGSEVSKDILYVQEGQTQMQRRGDPPYRPDDRIFTLLTTESEEGFCGSLLGSNSRYDLYEEDHAQILYRRGMPSPDLNTMRLPMAEEVRTRITTTTKNPAVYGEKFRLADFSAFVVEDLKERGLLASTETITERTALLTANSRQTEVLPESFPTESSPAAATEGGDLS